MKQTTSRKASALSFERQYIKSYMRLITQQASITVQKVDNYFFAEDGSEDELKLWYYSATVFYIAVGAVLFMALN